MSNFRDTLDELFVNKLNFEFVGTQLPIPSIPNLENITSISKEYTARGIDVIVAVCKDRIPEFQKQVIKAHKSDFPNAHFLFVSNEGKVFDLYNVSTAKKLKPITYNEIERNTLLFREKIELFNVEEAEGTVDLKIKIEKAFDVNDKVTKKFFDKFQKIHEKLQSGISGIESKDDKAWYTSVLLNRIMFIYFLQKHNVIQNDANFLLNKFDEVTLRGEDYYKDFLLPLFFLGFARKDRDPLKQEFTKKNGPIRYLNGGLFYPHHIENKYSVVQEEIVGDVHVKPVNDPLRSTIEVDANVLKEILEFLNGYTWYLDNRPMKDEKDINPDVLGYIFEKYINQKELGAYYTKEDITEYISKNTIIPFILDKLRAKGYNAPDPAPLITENKDIKQAIADCIEQITDYDELKYLYNDILLPLSVLDPAVGSGAFLFAALNILLPIYRKLIFKLKAFRNPSANVILSEVPKEQAKNPAESIKMQNMDSSSDKKHRTQNDHAHVTDPWLETLCKTLEAHSEEYFLTKQIILNNLYGVDIVEEATEICKLRLFLQLASHLPNIQHIEPLPDIDFNIYAGNSLVGGLSWNDLLSNYAMKLFDKEGNKIDEKKIEETIERVSNLKATYRTVQQTVDDEAALKTLKDEIQQLENRLNNVLIDIGVSNPFHWFIEFNDIIARGGFDVVIGNPPYVKISKINYPLNHFNLKAGDVYAYFIQRSLSLLNPHGKFGYIVMHSIAFSEYFVDTRTMLKNKDANIWFSFYGRIPAGLFSGNVRVRNCIVIYSGTSESKKYFTTRLHRWFSEKREGLFENLHYTSFKFVDTIPMFNDAIEAKIFENNNSSFIKEFLNRSSSHKLYFKPSAYNWISATPKEPPAFDKDGSPINQTNDINFVNDEIRKICCLLFNGRFFFSYWLIYGDEFHVTQDLFEEFRFPINEIKKKDKEKLADLYREFAVNLKNVIQYKLNAGKKLGNFNTAKLWRLTDRSDKIFISCLTDDVERVHRSILKHIQTTVLTNIEEVEEEREEE